jgi:hypothetical protein
VCVHGFLEGACSLEAAVQLGVSGVVRWLLLLLALRMPVRRW